LFSGFLLKLNEEERRMFTENFISSLSIKDMDVIEISTVDNITAWKVRGKREDGYVVARDIDSSMSGQDRDRLKGMGL
jgi:hypothetical protein